MGSVCFNMGRWNMKASRNSGKGKRDLKSERGNKITPKVRGPDLLEFKPAKTDSKMKDHKGKTNRRVLHVTAAI